MGESCTVERILKPIEKIKQNGKIMFIGLNNYASQNHNIGVMINEEPQFNLENFHFFYFNNNLHQRCSIS